MGVIGLNLVFIWRQTGGIEHPLLHVLHGGDLIELSFIADVRPSVNDFNLAVTERGISRFTPL
jgi:hypothetical protein